MEQKPPMEQRYKIRAVAFEHNDHWVAQCLEHDIATQAPTLDAILFELERILAAHILAASDGEPFAHLQKAPEIFWTMYEKAVTKVAPVNPPAWMIPEAKRPHLEVRYTEAAA